jgi:hypothetical protein
MGPFPEVSERLGHRSDPHGTIVCHPPDGADQRSAIPLSERLSCAALGNHIFDSARSCLLKIITASFKPQPLAASDKAMTATQASIVTS